MTTYYRRDGREQVANGHDDKGRPVIREHRPCLRCGGQGGSDAWRATGWKCYRCGGERNDPAGPFTERLYTAAELAKLDAALAKRRATAQAKAVEKAKAERAQRDAEWEAYYQPRFPVIDSILAYRQVHDITHRVAIDIEAHKQPSDDRLALAASIILAKLAEGDLRRGSRHVGTVGERVELELFVERVLSFTFDGYPRITTYINLCRDRAGNRIVYKGSNPLDEGEWLRLKATIKGHDEREGELQTLIARPKVIEEAA